LAIVGAGGHGRVVADAALVSGWDEVVFFDDAWPESRSTGPWSIAGRTEDIVRHHELFESVIVAIGNNQTRVTKQRYLEAQSMNVISVIHPKSVVSPRAQIGQGNAILAGAVVGAFVHLGSACIINTGASVDHDCVLSDGVHVSPGARVGGSVRIGEASWIGIGAAVREGISIGANVLVGAGAAVVSDVPDRLTVVGVPARPRDERTR
jgi:sugar O-acyltransferase (sialic acid O-acetyltransferase NeuD family)